jgi:hypothetical protein
MYTRTCEHVFGKDWVVLEANGEPPRIDHCIPLGICQHPRHAVTHTTKLESRNPSCGVGKKCRKKEIERKNKLRGKKQNMERSQK